jgi:hypothetical protein
MSSINKSGKRFTPKIKQRERRVPGLTTPVSSQTPSSQVPQTPINSQVSNTPISPVSQKFTQNANLKRTVNTIDSENENLSDVDELKQDKTSNLTAGSAETSANNTPAPVLKQTLFEPLEAVPTVEQPYNDNIDVTVETSETNIQEKPPMKQVDHKLSSTTTITNNHQFTQPSSTSHRTRLNSLSIPTPLPGYGTNRRGSVNINTSKSRQGSFAIPVIAPGSRRGSTTNNGSSGIGPITINPGSRRGSVNTFRPTFGNNSTNNDRSRRGSVNTINNERLGSLNDEKSTPIPIMKSNKKRRVNISVGTSKSKDVTVGGISLPGSNIPIKKSLSDNKEVEENVIEDSKTNNELDEVNSIIENKDEAMTESNIESIMVDSTIEKPVFKKKLEVTKEERLLNQKWVMNTATKKFELVKISELEEDPIRQQEYAFDYEITNLSEITEFRKDTDAQLGISLKFNPKSMKMSDLCKPFLAVGEISQNYHKAMEGEKKLNESRKKRKQLRESARKLRMSVDDLMKLTENADFASFALDEKHRMEKVKEMMDRDRGDENKKHNVPLLEIQDGRVTYSHESTVVDRHEEANIEMEKIEENPFENIITSGSYSKKSYTLKWTAQEVAELLKAISLFGTDFGLISQLFPHRTRKQVKAKFLLEEKVHPHLVEFALLRKLPINVDEYSGKSGKEFKSLDEYNKQLEELKLKHEEELKLMEEARAQAHAEDRAIQQQSMHRNEIGGIPTRRSRKAVIAEFRKNEEIVGTINNS